MIDLKERFFWGSIISFLFFTIAIFGFGYIYVAVNGCNAAIQYIFRKKK